MKRSIHSLLGFGLVGALLAVVLLGLVWLPYDPLAIDLDHTLAAPSLAHWLGTDEFGRDVASRAMLGARISLLIAIQTVVLSVVIGTALGLVVGFLRGWTERVIMTFSDALLAFPGILLALARLAGETAPLLFTAFGNNFMTAHPLDKMASMPVTIYQYTNDPNPVLHAIAWAGALLITLFVLALSLLTRIMFSRKKVSYE